MQAYVIKKIGVEVHWFEALVEGNECVWESNKCSCVFRTYGVSQGNLEDRGDHTNQGRRRAEHPGDSNLCGQKGEENISLPKSWFPPLDLSIATGVVDLIRGRSLWWRSLINNTQLNMLLRSEQQKSMFHWICESFEHTSLDWIVAMRNRSGLKAPRMIGYTGGPRFSIPLTPAKLFLLLTLMWMVGTSKDGIFSIALPSLLNPEGIKSRVTFWCSGLT